MKFRVERMVPQHSVNRLEGQEVVLDVHRPSLPHVQVGTELELELRPELPADLTEWSYVAQGEPLSGHASTYSFGGLLLCAPRLPTVDPAFLCIR